MMNAKHEAVVNRAEFVKALQGWAPRTPIRVRGAKSKVPLDVLIYDEDGVLILDFPTMAIRLSMKGRWGIRISVKHSALALAASNLRADDELSLIYASGSLSIDGGAFVLPAREEVGPAES